MIKSIWFAFTRALCKAILAASTPIVVVVSSNLVAYRRSLMPVRSCIHSSLVSITFVKSLLVTTFLGTYIPIPEIFERFINKHYQMENYEEVVTMKGETGVSDDRPAFYIFILVSRGR